MIRLILMYRKGIILLTAYCLVLSLASADPPGWTEDRRIGFLPGDHWNPRADCCGDTVHLVYQRVWTAPDTVWEEVYYKRSTDAGNTWEQDILLSHEDLIHSIMPDIAVKGDTVVVVWNESQSDGVIQYRISEDGGISFGPIDSLKAPGMAYPSVDMVADTIYLAIQSSSAGGNPGVYFTKSTDGGYTWDSLRLIYNDTLAREPRLSVSWPDVHIVFTARDSIYRAGEIFYLGSHDGGRTWDEAIIISDQDSINSPLAFNTSWSGGTAASWYDGKYSPYPWTGDIFVRRRNKFGQWLEIDSLTTAHRAVWSDILAERTHLHVVWEDERHDPGHNFEIYYRESPDLGITWYPEVRLTNARYHSRRPSLACGGRYLHCFWADARDDTIYPPGIVTQIYYKRKDLSISTPEGYQVDIPGNISVSPNPFRKHTIISFSLFSPSACLEIYDQAGRRVFRQDYAESRQHRVVWSTERAGIYFVRFKTEGVATVRKVVALK